MADAKHPSGQRSQAARHGDLKALARHRAQSLGVDARGHLDGGDRGRTRFGLTGMKAHGPRQRPALDRRVHRTGQALVPCPHIGQTFLFEQGDGHLQPSDVGQRRRATKLGRLVVAVAALPVPVKTRLGMAG